MRYFIGILLTVALIGCKSPLDVDASRQTEYPEQNGSRLFRIEPSRIELGFVHPGDTARFSFKIVNVGSKKLDVEYMEWSYFDFLNKLTEFSGSFSLDPKGSISSERTINCSFVNVVSGNYRDTLRINNYLSPQIALFAVVPDIYLKDVAFRNTNVGGQEFEHVLIYNNSPRAVVLKAAQTPSNGPFSVTNSLPLELPAFNFVQLVIAFVPSTPGNYSQTLKIVLEGAEGLIVNDAAILTGSAL